MSTIYEATICCYWTKYEIFKNKMTIMLTTRENKTGWHYRGYMDSWKRSDKPEIGRTLKAKQIRPKWHNATPDKAWTTQNTHTLINFRLSLCVVAFVFYLTKYLDLAANVDVCCRLQSVHCRVKEKRVLKTGSIEQKKRNNC